MSKKFFLYIMLPGIVLGMAYHLGRQSGVHLPVESSVSHSNSIPTSVPVPPDSSEFDRKLSIISEKLSQIESLRSGRSSVLKPDDIPDALPVERYQVRQIPSRVETADGLIQTGLGSVYDRDSPNVLESEVVPLSPLLPFDDTAVLPGMPSAPSRTTFKEPARSAPVPATPLPAYRVTSPVRVTSSSECDCGQEH